MIQRTKKYRLGRRSHPPSFQVAKPDACCLKRTSNVVPLGPIVKRDLIRSLCKQPNHVHALPYFWSVTIRSPTDCLGGPV